MWRSKSRQVEGGRGYKVAIYRHDIHATFRNVIEAWQQDKRFRVFFIRKLTGVPSSAPRWERPPVTRATVDHPFESVIIDDPALAQL